METIGRVLEMRFKNIFTLIEKFIPVSPAVFIKCRERYTVKGYNVHGVSHAWIG
jgi:hypothetical protein